MTKRTAGSIRLRACRDCCDWIVGAGRGRTPNRCEHCQKQHKVKQRAERYGEPYARTGQCLRCGTVVVASSVKGPTPLRCDNCRAQRTKEVQRECYQRLGAEHFSKKSRQSRLRNKWGISAVEFDALLASQGGRCAICRSPEPGGSGGWHIDHDHGCCPPKSSCGKCIRGLLCSRCNTGLGQLRDDPEVMRRAAEYVERFRSRV